MDSNRPWTATGNGTRSWTRLLGVPLLSSIALTGCLRPYSKSVFDPPTAQFPGITSEWRSPTGADIRVIFVHGICTHDESWITAGWDVVIKGYFPSESMTATTKPPVGQIQIIDHEYQIGENKISGRYLIWSALTADDKKNLHYDNLPTDSPWPGEFHWKRAKINGELKASLLNDCLSDAVIYAGYRGAEIQAAMQNAICASLDGTTTNGNCDFPPFTATAAEESLSSPRASAVAWYSTRSQR